MNLYFLKLEILCPILVISIPKLIKFLHKIKEAVKTTSFCWNMKTKNYEITISKSLAALELLITKIN